MSPCVSRERLKGFLADRLDDPATADVADHVEGCPDCRRVLDELTSGPPADLQREEGDDPAGLTGWIDRLKGLGPRRGDAADPDRAGPAAGYSEGPTVAGDSATMAFVEPPTIPNPGAWPVIDGFRIIREVGRGGMGVVYEAEEERLGRHVALKVLAATALLHPKQVMRFEREARLAAGLHHTHIVPVHGSGAHAGHHYYFMQFIEGRGLDAVFRELRAWRGDPASRPSTAELPALTGRGRLTFAGLARIGLGVAEALGHAHRHGVLHRDIKPSNLLLDADGTVWVADFGLAKALEADEITSTGDVPGTIRYMAPERFAGRCDERSDLYGLGLTLYELASLRPAYEGRDTYELMERMRREDPPPLRKLDPRIPRDLETIVHKAMARDPAARYPNASDLAADLRRFLEGRPIVARRASVPERCLRWCRRNPWAAAFLAALLCGTIGSSWEAIRATRAEANARTERDHAERSRDRALEAVRRLLVLEEGGEEGLLVEEARPYRRALIRAGLRETQELVRDLEGAGALGNLVSAYHAMARLQNDDGDRAAAVTSARKAVDLAQDLWDHGQGVATGRLLGFALSQLGAVLPDVEASREATRRSTGVFQVLLDRRGGSEREGWIQQIVINHYNSGDRLDAAGRHRESVEEFLGGRAACESALREFGEASKVRGMLAKTEGHLCRSFSILGRNDEALAAGRRAIEVGRDLLRDHPDDLEIAMDLETAHRELGLRYLAAGDSARAIGAFESDRRLLKDLAARPGQPLSRVAKILARLPATDLNLWNACDSELFQHAELRRALMIEAFGVCDKLSLVGPLPDELPYIYAHTSTWTAYYREQDIGAPDLDLIRQAERRWLEILRLNPKSPIARGYLVIVRGWLADELAARGRREEAERSRRTVTDTARGDADLLFEIAMECLRFAHAGGPSEPAPGPGPAGLDALRLRFEHEAMGLIRDAIAAGYRDAERLRVDPLLARLRPTPEFKALLGGLAPPADPSTGRSSLAGGKRSGDSAR